MKSKLLAAIACCLTAAIATAQAEDGSDNICDHVRLGMPKTELVSVLEGMDVTFSIESFEDLYDGSGSDQVEEMFLYRHNTMAKEMAYGWRRLPDTENWNGTAFEFGIGWDSKINLVYCFLVLRNPP